METHGADYEKFDAIVIGAGQAAKPLASLAQPASRIPPGSTFDRTSLVSEMPHVPPLDA